ncbi:molybdopterin molybdotransferase MoeA [Arthrobacter sp. Sa2BUA2]|uniref:Molybdopterin molybdenumtransferase n=1 Tax=Arthrobacter pullicola TaxID=2762224 RepID=A0ABR8YFC9_9MICC|nr:gephyrin-like molybdotransferase Glp [Arthrobacter pullicola]MBD8042913.1 molybdopterin molybdotransferase MoeA [Arthrobacter pullicola]
MSSTGTRTRTVGEHRQQVQDLLAGWLAEVPVRTETLGLEQAAGRVLAGNVRAPRSLPPFDNSQMDGYAVRASDLTAVPSPASVQADTVQADTVQLLVAEPIPAGTAAPALAPGTAAPIMTGAMLPAGADAVIPIERAVPDSFYPATEHSGATVALPAGIAAGQFVRPAGSDIAEGRVALAAGTRLGAAHLGLLAGLGLDSVTVRGRFRVLLLSTGDEVVEPGKPLAPGQIHDANTTLLSVSLREAGAEVTHSRIVADRPGLFLEQLRDDLRGHPADLVLTSGGISKGAYEVVRQALSAGGAEFLSVAMQPGGPQGIGTVDGIPFLGFPGNPVSCLVSFEMFLRPALSALTGMPAPRREIQAKLADAAASPAGKLQIRRGRYMDGAVELVGGPGSHLIHALASSNALVQLPEDTEHAAAGSEVTVWLLD